MSYDPNCVKCRYARPGAAGDHRDHRDHRDHVAPACPACVAGDDDISSPAHDHNENDSARCAECGGEMISLAAGARCFADATHRGEVES